MYVGTYRVHSIHVCIIVGTHRVHTYIHTYIPYVHTYKCMYTQSTFIHTYVHTIRMYICTYKKDLKVNVLLIGPNDKSKTGHQNLF
jgi:hypothetical protein